MSASIKLDNEPEQTTESDIHKQLCQAAAERNGEKVKSLLQEGAGKSWGTWVYYLMVQE